MGIIKRQSLKTSVVNYTGILIGVIFFNFVFPHLISEEYLGLINLLQNLTFVFVSLPALGLAHVLLRYYSNWRDTPRVAQFNAFAFWIMAIAIVLFAIAYLVFKQPIIDNYKTHSALFIPYYILVIPLVGLLVFTQYFEIYGMLRLRVAVPAFLREILTRVLLITLVFLFIFDLLTETQFVYGLLVAFLIPALVLAVYSVTILKFKATGAKKFINDNPNWKSQLWYGGGMLLLTLCSNVHNFLDGIILPAYLGLGTLGIYARPLVLGQMIQVPYRAISQIASPIIREAIVENDLKKVYTLNKNIGINLFLIGCFLFTLLVSNAGGIFSLLPTSYSVARNVLYIIAFGRLVDMAFGLNTEILNYSKYYPWIIATSVIMMLLTITLNIILIPRLGMDGAAWAVSTSLIIFNLMKSVVIFRKFHFHCFSLHYLTLIILSCTVIGLLYLVPNLTFIDHHMFMNACLNIAFRAFLGTILFVLPVYFLKVSPDLNEFLKLLLSGKIFRGGHRMNEL